MFARTKFWESKKYFDAKENTIHKNAKNSTTIKASLSLDFEK